MLAVFVFAAVFVAHGAYAQSPLTLDTNIARTIGLTTVDIRTYVSLIIRYFLTLLGIIAVILMMYAGFLWMTAQGNEEQIKTAKRIMTNAVIGLIIIVSAYSIAAFLLNMINSGTGSSITSGGNGGAAAQLYGSNGTGGVLGNGIISYHYPEPGQQNVPRNTKISITFKKPLVLSTVLANYDDNGTYDTSDDRLCPGAPPCPTAPLISSLTTAPTFALNVENVKLIANDAMKPGGSGTIDQQFSTRYPTAGAVSSPPPVARYTVTVMPLAAGQDQTLVFKPVTPIGSPSVDVNYRVALRGGDNGVKVWSMPTTGTTPTAGDAFPRAYADGGYYWAFTTGTLIDLTSPKIVAVEPFVTTTPGTPTSTVLDRNQLLQIYFDKPIDPTSSTGSVGSAGFSNLEFAAQCLPGTAGVSCVFNNGATGTVSGEVTIGNRDQTLEFTPNAPCEGVTENSCGEKVYCLPANVNLTVRALAATVGASGPTAVASNGIVDMSDNSLDGNNNGTAEGPQPPAQPSSPRTLDYFRNNPPDQTALATVSDTARWQYVVGQNIDLTPPTITDVDPPTPPPESANYSAGPSNVPPLLSPSITWSKVMSITSMQTGAFNELTGQYTPNDATLVLRSKECAKIGTAACPTASGSVCPCTPLDPPGFFIDSGAPIESPAGSQNYVSKTSFMHPTRPFYTANDLGYTDADIASYSGSGNIPIYVPVARAQIRDTKQNCFWPSQYTQCTVVNGQTSCCNRLATSDQNFLTDCKPQ